MKKVAASNEVTAARTGAVSGQSVHDSLIDERAIDTELADSFPASDPPSWTSVIAETHPPTRPASTTSE